MASHVVAGGTGRGQADDTSLSVPSRRGSPHPMLTVTLPDGRSVHLDHEGPAGNWVGRLDGADGRSAAGRWLLAILGELLGLPPGKKPPWLLDLVRELVGRDTPAGRRYACPCCDLLTLTEPPTGTFAICPVCRWEDDNLQFEDLDREPGANAVSLRQARQNFGFYGVSDTRRRERARPPRAEEMPAPGQD